MPSSAPPKPTYLSGWCGTTQHDRCRGAYGGAGCRCACHDSPAPDVCQTCGQTLPEARRG